MVYIVVKIPAKSSLNLETAKNCNENDREGEEVLINDR